MAEDYQLITIQNALLRYESVFEARPRSEDKPDELWFGATVIMDNDRHGKMLDHIDAITDRVALDEFKKKVPLKNRPVKDGNEKSDVEGFGDGVSFLNAYRKTRPGVVDRNLNALAKEDGVLYAGCTVNITVRLFAYDHKQGGKGVTCELVAIQFVADGERFSGGASTDATKYFKPLDGEGGGETGGRSSPGRSSRSSAGSTRSSGGSQKVDLSGF